jgi:hypothetical protein
MNSLSYVRPALFVNCNAGGRGGMADRTRIKVGNMECRSESNHSGSIASTFFHKRLSLMSHPLTTQLAMNEHCWLAWKTGNWKTGKTRCYGLQHVRQPAMMTCEGPAVRGEGEENE